MFFIGSIQSSRSFRGASGSEEDQITQSTPLDSGTFLYAAYSMSSTENNRPPWVLSVEFSDEDPVIGSIYTITCLWDKQSSGAIAPSELKVYRQDYINTIAGTLNRTLVDTLTDGVDTEYGTIISTVYTYEVQVGDLSKRLSFDFIGKVTGVENTQSAILSSDLTATIGADLPAVYDDVAPEELLLHDGYDADADTWPNVGTDGGIWTATGSGQNKETGGHVSFNGSGGLTKSITAGSDSNWVAWAKFSWTNAAEIKTLFELSNNRQLEILTSGQIRLKSTTNQSTSGTLSLTTQYNLICEHASSGNFYVRVELNNGTLVLEETLTGSGTNGITSGTATICEDLEATNRFVGSLWELGVKHGTITGTQRTNILTRLKSIGT